MGVEVEKKKAKLKFSPLVQMDFLSWEKKCPGVAAPETPENGQWGRKGAPTEFFWKFMNILIQPCHTSNHMYFRSTKRLERVKINLHC